jgi:UDP-N-acetylglucosamine 2-epimerase (non-hydrolysing)
MSGPGTGSAIAGARRLRRRGAAIVYVVGARPNFVKTAPVVEAMRRRLPGARHVVVHTGQHYDAEMSGVFLRELGLATPDVFLGVGSGTHAEQTAGALVGVERVLLERRPALVVVVGDVNSTLAGALAAAKLNIPVAHLEAGLRSFDPTMPEERNRLLTDHLSDLLLVHSQSAVENLAREGIPGDRVHLVGNTMIDSLFGHLQQSLDRRPWTSLGVEPGGYGLVTLHRPSLVDDPVLLAATAAQLASLSALCPIVFPVHPRTLQQLHAQSLVDAFDGSRVIVTEPLGYEAFLGLEAHAMFVLTDSGGVQEETSALRVPCFTLREGTERPVTVELGTNIVLGSRPERISEIPALLGRPFSADEIPHWDGHAGERAAKVLSAWLAAHA